MIHKTLQTLLVCVLSIIIAVVFTQQNRMIIPIQIETANTSTSIKLQSIGIKSPKIAEAINLASKQTGLSPEFLIALMNTESSGKINSISSKGYKGLMQIPHTIYQEDANVLIGAHIFNEKMKQAQGNIIKALCLYKGYPVDSDRGYIQARKVLTLYEKLRRTEV